MKSKGIKKVFAVFTALLMTFSVVAPAAELESRAKVGGISTLIPGGMAFGVKFFTDGAVILGTTGVETASGVVSPAKDAGLKSGDIITEIGGEDFESAAELSEVVAGCGGRPIVVEYMRNGEEFETTVTPARDIESGRYKMGVLVKDSTAGIGTVTYIDPETMDFGGLGHGIYDSETGQLLPLGMGAVVNVEITDVVKSEKNNPGQLKGRFDNVAIGTLWDNCEEGVFGRYIKYTPEMQAPMPVAEWDEVKEGKAYIQTTLSEDGIGQYEIEIEEIYKNSGSTKNYLVRVTDEALISKTGGIVQGMSGSPIIQNGKLVGAVTHVLVNDPLRGYGIFIENMLRSAYDVDVQEKYAPIAA